MVARIRFCHLDNYLSIRVTFCYRIYDRTTENGCSSPGPFDCRSLHFWFSGSLDCSCLADHVDLEDRVDLEDHVDREGLEDLEKAGTRGRSLGCSSSIVADSSVVVVFLILKNSRVDYYTRVLLVLPCIVAGISADTPCLFQLNRSQIGHWFAGDLDLKLFVRWLSGFGAGGSSGCSKYSSCSGSSVTCF